MKVIIYDMSDDPHARPPIILRLVDDTGCLRVQSPIYGDADFTRNLGDVLANAFDTELLWLGPSSSPEDARGHVSDSDPAGLLLREAMLEQLVPDDQFADGFVQRSLF